MKFNFTSKDVPETSFSQSTSWPSTHIYILNFVIPLDRANKSALPVPPLLVLINLVPNEPKYVELLDPKTIPKFSGIAALTPS